MSLSRNLLHTSIICCAAILLPVVLYMMVSFHPPLEPVEKKFLVSPPSLVIPGVRVWKHRSVQCPITQKPRIVEASKKIPVTSSVAIHRRIPPRLTLVFQVSGENRAIMNGVVTREGGVVSGWTVLKIEQGRVLLKQGKEKQWLSID